MADRGVPVESDADGEDTALRALEARFAALVDHLPLGALVEDAERRVAVVNQAFCDLFGIPVPPAAMVGADCAAAAEDVKGLFADPDGFIASNAAALDGGAAVQGTLLALADGRVLERDYAPVRGDGVGLGHLWMYRDVTERRRAAAENDRLRGFYEQVLHAVPAQMAVFDREARFLYCNVASIGDPDVRAWVIGKRNEDYCRHRGVPEAIGLERTAQILAVVREGRTHYFEETFERHGEQRWFGRYLAPVRDGDGTVVQVVGFGHDQTEMRRAEAIATSARAEAERAAAERERFLATVSHELRTPLNAVVGLSHVLAQGSLAPEQARTVGGIQHAADSLLGIINDLLDLSRIRAGELRLQHAPFELRRVLDGLADAFRPSAAQRGLAMEIEVEAGVPDAIVGDAMRLNQVLTNLLGNALKFTEQGRVSLGVAAVSTGDGRPALRFRVTDTGIGIPADAQERIFGLFQQGGDHVASRYGGSGLGLAIVRALVSQQGGTVAVDSRPGEGTTFEVMLPCEFASASAVPPRHRASPHVSLAGRRLLLVEDNVLNRQAAVAILEQGGAIVSTASNGREGVEMVATGRFDLVLMDVQMPEMDGFEATWRIRNDLGIGPDRLPIIALSATALTDERRRAQAAGMSDFIMKPFRPDLLCEQLAGILAGTAPSAIEAPTSPREFLHGSRDAASVAPAASAVDPVFIERLAFLPGTEGRDMATELVESLAARMPTVRRAMADALAAGDLARLARESHSLRGTALMLGATGLAAQARALEERALAGSGSAIPVLLAAIDAGWPGTITALRAACAGVRDGVSASPPDAGAG